MIADKDDGLLKIIDSNGKTTGKYERRAIVHSHQLFHNEVALWIIDKENKKVLLQRRSPNKKQNPNKLALCAGHVVEKENTLKTLYQAELSQQIGAALLGCDPYQNFEVTDPKHTGTGKDLLELIADNNNKSSFLQKNVRENHR